MRCEQTIRQRVLGSGDSRVLGFSVDVHGMNVTLNQPEMIVEDSKRIMIDRAGQKMTVNYGDLQIDDLFYFEDNAGAPRRYRVIDISGTPTGEAEITTEMINFRMGQLYGSMVG